MAKVKHAPAVAAVDATREEWRLGGERIVRNTNPNKYEHEYEIFGICDPDKPALYSSKSDISNLFSVISAILGASESRRLVDEQHGKVYLKDSVKENRPSRIVVTENAKGDAGWLVVGKVYDVVSWDSLGRPQVLLGGAALWYLSNRQGEWDTTYPSFSKWVPFVGDGVCDKKVLF